MAENKKKTNRKRTNAKTIKKEVADTGAAQEFVEMMAGKNVPDIDIEPTDKISTVSVDVILDSKTDEVPTTNDVSKDNTDDNVDSEEAIEKETVELIDFLQQTILVSDVLVDTEKKLYDTVETNDTTAVNEKPKYRNIVHTFGGVRYD